MKAKVYIVIRRDYETGIPDFQGVFFSKEAAVAFVAEARNQARYPEDYKIEVHEEAENGRSVCASILYRE